MQLKSEWGQEV